MQGTVKWGGLLIVLGGLLVVAGAGIGATTADTAGLAASDIGLSNETDPPLADAGLDQTVPSGTTVYLDGGGSVAPEGKLTAYSWEIERPDGSTTTPTCTTNTCVRASFVPTQLGIYNVTLTVTDDTGETATDTLYVIVEEGNPPTAQLTGPDRLSVGEQGTFVLTATRGDAPLSSIHWTVDGDPHTSSFVGGETRWELNHTFGRPGTHIVGGTVTDVRGLDARDWHTVTVGPSDGPIFLVEITDTDSPIAAGETLTVDAAVTNVGNESDTQTVTLETFTGDTPDSTAVSLSPGENTTVAFEWDTTGDDVGEGPVTVTSENDTDSEPVTIVSGNGTFFGVTDVDYDWPDDEKGSIAYTVTYKNLGNQSGNQTVEVTQPGGSRTLGRHPLQLDAGESATLTYEWGLDYEDDWHDYAGKDVLVVASTEDHDRDEYFPVPELPTFEVDFTHHDITTTLRPPVDVIHLRGVEITNTGDVAGSRPVEFWVDATHGTGGKVDQLQDDTYLPDGLSLDPGESYETGHYPGGPTQLYWTEAGGMVENATLRIKTPSDEDSINVRWDGRDPIPPPPGGGPPRSCSGDFLDVDHEDYALELEKVHLTVALVECNPDGSTDRRFLTPGEYTISYDRSGSEAGTQYLTTGPDWVRGEIPRRYSDVGLAFQITYNANTSIATASGARWFRDKEDIPND